MLLLPPLRLCFTRRLFVYMLVCLLTTSRKKLLTGSTYKFYHRCISAEEKLIKIWKASASGCGCRNCWRDSAALQNRALFHTLWLMSAREPNRCLRKFYHKMCLQTRKYPLNFGSHPDRYYGSPDYGHRIRIQPWPRSALYECCFVKPNYFNLAHIFASTRLVQVRVDES